MYHEIKVVNTAEQERVNLNLMGMFDTVYVSRDVAEAWRLQCPKCEKPPAVDCTWQTKALDPAMYSYFLRYDDAGVIRLYLLDPASDRRFWREWTEEEIKESESLASKREGAFAFLQKKAGEGCFLPEAYLPQHRRQRFMGELPHQWVEIYTSCECAQFIEVWIKFCDGVATECRSKAPSHEPGFFDGAGDWF